MKNNIYITCLMAVLMTLLCVSCTSDKKASVGEYDRPDNYGVYFPVQSGTGDFLLADSEPCVLTFRVNRTRTDDAVTVPFVVRSEDAEIFNVSEIFFDEEDASAEFTVSFPSAIPGRTYECTIVVNDPLYVSYYSSVANHVTFRVTRVRR